MNAPCKTACVYVARLSALQSKCGATGSSASSITGTNVPAWLSMPSRQAVRKAGWLSKVSGAIVPQRQVTSIRLPCTIRERESDQARMRSRGSGFCWYVALTNKLPVPLFWSLTAAGVRSCLLEKWKEKLPYVAPAKAKTSSGVLAQ